ncbi:hypothetical protein CSV86_029450 [Pseudomonas putida CSV86]|uniref:Uncharacterized protein n=1 Tax=Pseudomonas bharatica CSV86 TaxID=1005395 RepID=A0A7K4EMP3_9PSED|nr:hypothetical protein [Pseudomonas bharatica]NNJ18944.1 hypothetical protein [Pseudomonas bharatica CSV86]
MLDSSTAVALTNQVNLAGNLGIAAAPTSRSTAWSPQRRLTKNGAGVLTLAAPMPPGWHPAQCRHPVVGNNTSLGLGP